MKKTFYFILIVIIVSVCLTKTYAQNKIIYDRLNTQIVFNPNSINNSDIVELIVGRGNLQFHITNIDSFYITARITPENEGSKPIILFDQDSTSRIYYEENRVVRTIYLTKGIGNSLIAKNSKDARQTICAILDAQPLRVKCFNRGDHAAMDEKIYEPMIYYAYKIVRDRYGWGELKITEKIPEAKLDFMDWGKTLAVGTNEGHILAIKTKEKEECMFNFGSYMQFGVRNGTYLDKSYSEVRRITIRDAQGKEVESFTHPHRFDQRNPGKSTPWNKAEDLFKALWQVAPLGSIEAEGSGDVENEKVSLYGFRELWKWGTQNAGLPILGKTASKRSEIPELLDYMALFAPDTALDYSGGSWNTGADVNSDIAWATNGLEDLSPQKGVQFSYRRTGQIYIDDSKIINMNGHPLIPSNWKVELYGSRAGYSLAAFQTKTYSAEALSKTLIESFAKRGVSLSKYTCLKNEYLNKKDMYKMEIPGKKPVWLVITEYEYLGQPYLIMGINIDEPTELINVAQCRQEEKEAIPKWVKYKPILPYDTVYVRPNNSIELSDLINKFLLIDESDSSEYNDWSFLKNKNLPFVSWFSNNTEDEQIKYYFNDNELVGNVTVLINDKPVYILNKKYEPAPWMIICNKKGPRHGGISLFPNNSSYEITGSDVFESLNKLEAEIIPYKCDPEQMASYGSSLDIVKVKGKRKFYLYSSYSSGSGGYSFSVGIYLDEPQIDGLVKCN